MGKGKYMRARARGFILTALATALVAASPADARKKEVPPPAPVVPPQVALPNSPNGVAVRYFYERRNYAPIWFKPGGEDAIAQLLSILNNAAVDGMANGPQVAATVGAMTMAARAGDEMKHKEAELALTAAWVDYVQTLQRPQSAGSGSSSSSCSARMRQRPSAPNAAIAACSARRSSVMPR